MKTPRTSSVVWRHCATVSLALSLCLSFVVNAASARKMLTGAQIRSTFVGKVVTDGFHWSYYLKPDGSIEGTELGRSRKGKWSIHENELCIEIAKGASADRCWGVVREGKTLIYQINGNDIQDVMVKERRPQ